MVVLSNNDGCVVARSAEAKALGVPMGAPLFKLRETVAEHAIVVCSSNYALYGDMSDRVYQVLCQFSPSVERYSIDECFLSLPDVPSQELARWGRDVQQRVRQWTGIPTGVGVAGTKTLAKLANWAAKRWRKTGGVVVLDTEGRRDWLLQRAPVDEVWGVGPRLAARLRSEGVQSGWDLARQDPVQIGRRFSVVLERTVRELNGLQCLQLEEQPPARQQIMVSRSFGEDQDQFIAVRAALASFVERAGVKLRQQGLVARLLTLGLHTNPFKPDAPQYHASRTIPLPYAMADNRLLLRSAEELLVTLWRDGFRYKKVGVLLGGLEPAATGQVDWLHQTDAERGQALMGVVDAANRRFGRQCLKFGAASHPGSWQLRAASLSPAYTTQWSDVPVVLAG